MYLINIYILSLITLLIHSFICVAILCIMYSLRLEFVFFNPKLYYSNTCMGLTFWSGVYFFIHASAKATFNFVIKEP